MSFRSRALSDTELLEAVRLRASGMAVVCIVRVMNMGESQIRNATQRVMNDDIRLSGDAEGDLRSQYWPQSPKGRRRGGLGGEGCGHVR